MSMTPKDRVLAAMKQESLDRPPVAIFTQSATLGMMDKTGAAWPEAHTDAGLMAKLGAAQADMFGFEAVRVPFCLTAEAERLGCKVAVEKRDAAPMIKEHPFKFDPMSSEYDSPDGLMDVEEFLSGGRPAVVMESIRKLVKSHGDDYPIIAGNTGPFTLTGHMVDTENMVFAMMMDPAQVTTWVSAITPILSGYTQALSDAGANVIQMSEPTASTDLIAPDMFFDASGKYIKECLANVKDAYSTLHICGNTLPILEMMVETGTTALSIEEKVDPFEAVEHIGGKIALVGNVGSVTPLYQGKPEDVAAETKRSAKAGFNVIAPGCGVASATKDENLAAMVKAIKG